MSSPVLTFLHHVLFGSKGEGNTLNEEDAVRALLDMMLQNMLGKYQKG